MEAAQLALTSVIGLAVVYIAYRQWRTDRDRLRNELFDRRYQLYEAAQQLIFDCINSATFNDEKYTKFRSEASSGQFVLSDPNVVEYLELLKKESLRLLNLLDAINELPAGLELEAKKTERRQLIAWFRDQTDAITQRFQRELKLTA